MKRKVLSLIMALAMILGTMGTGVFAEDVTVATKTELDTAISNATDGDTICLTADIDYGSNQLKIEKAIILDLGGNTLTTANNWGGMSLKNNPTIKNGAVKHTGNTAAIKAWNVAAFEDLTVEVSVYTEDKIKGGIVIQNNHANRIDTIKNVTIKGEGLTNGIETYNCGDATQPVIGSMENVTIDAVGTGMLISAPCGTATNCSINGGTTGIELWIKGTYNASLDLVNCDIKGGDKALFIHDEVTSNPDAVNDGELKLTADADSTFTSENGVVIDYEITRAENVELSENIRELLPLEPKGSINGGLVNIQDKDRTFLTIESYITYANESIVVKVYDANDVLLATSTLVDNNRVLLGKKNFGLSTLIGINCTDEWWNTVWEEGKLRADYVPAKATLFVDGGQMNTAVVQMRAAGTELPVNWADVPGVAPAGPVEVKTYEELVAALAKDNANVIMMNDITATATQSTGYGKTGIIVDSGDILDGNGKTLTINGANATWDSVITMRGGEVKNLTIAGAMRGAFMPGANGDVVIDNCIFKDVIYTFNSDAGSKDYTVTIKNSTINGWTSFSNVHKSVTFENCTFGEGSGYAYCRPYQPTEFNGCDFGEDYGVDASQTAANSLVFNDCTYDGAPLSAGNGWQMFSGGSDVIIDGEEVHFIASDKTVASVGNTAYDNLQDALNAAVMAGEDVTVEILTDIDLSNIDWSPVSVNGSLNPAAHLVTVNGNNHTITNLNNMLFSGTWAGKSGLIINDLTIADSNIVNDKDDTAGTVGVGAFIGYPQASETITLNNCHLINSTVEGGHWTGGLIGMAGGYNGNDGPVFMNLTITGCSVKDSVITGKGSAGGLMGHASCAAWTKVVVENTVVSGNAITSTGSSNEKAGAVFGTVGAAGTATTADGETKTGGQFVAATVENNTVTSNNTTITTIYGRQGSETGKLELTGGTYDHKPISGEEAWAGVKEGFVLKINSNGTYGVVPDVEVVWTTATDAGFYRENDVVKGMMRFLFHAGLDKEITASGIHYIDSADITAKVKVGETETGDSNAFHGDIINIPEDRTGRYYAVGFVVADGKYYWSEPVECEPNFTKEFTEYVGGVE